MSAKPTGSKPMRRVGLGLLAGGALITVTCVWWRAPITEDRELDRDNPTEWLFDASVPAVMECVEGDLPNATLDAWGGGVRLDVIESERLSGVVLSSDLTHGVHSERYLHHQCPLPLYASWRVDVHSVEDRRTRVSIRTVRSPVHNYHCLYIGHPWGCDVPVEPSTIEEYQLLRRIGTCLGVPDMPPVRLPSGDRPDVAACR